MVFLTNVFNNGHTENNNPIGLFKYRIKQREGLGETIFSFSGIELRPEFDIRV